MDQPLRCNNQAGGFCRAQLTQEAIVTTCSHIFCVPCWEKLGLSTIPLDQRRCPACKTTLSHTDDAVKNLLSPSDEYKTSALSGLDPATIMDCASRAMSFWTYQKSQELAYQEHISRNLTERYRNLSTTLDKTVSEANTLIEGLKSQIEEERQSRAQAVELYRAKSKQQALTQRLYETLKKRYRQEHMEQVAENDVTRSLQSIHHTLPRPGTLDTLPGHDFTMQPPKKPNLGEPGPNWMTSLRDEPASLHPHQRTGHRIVERDQNGMPPLDRTLAPRHHAAAVTTPAHLVPSPGQARSSIHLSQIALNVPRSHSSSTKIAPGSSRWQSIHPAKIPRSAQQYGGIASGIRVGRIGTSGSFETVSKFGLSRDATYRAPPWDDHHRGVPLQRS